MKNNWNRTGLMQLTQTVAKIINITYLVSDVMKLKAKCTFKYILLE